MTSSAVADRQARAAGLASSNSARIAGLLVSLAVLAAVIVLSIGIGARDIAPETVWQALWAFDDAVDEHVMIRELRVPRTVTGIVSGIALGISGALIQAFTRNPLADPGILGVNAGAAFAVTIAVGVLGIAAPLGYIWFALGGAAVVTVVVYLLGSVGGGGSGAGLGRATPAKLTLAGVSIGAVLGGVTTAVVLSSRDTFDIMRFWGVGTIGGRDLSAVLAFTPLIGIGVLLAFVVARPLNALALGDELASSLGVKIAHIRATVIIAVTLLAGTATALAGPIAFVGLMVPHIVRWFVGPDQRWIILYTLLLSPVLLLAADILGRVLLPSGELRVGLVTALVGAPVLIALARRSSVSGL